MKRETSTRAPSPLIETWRGFEPTVTVPLTAPLLFKRSNWPVASSATHAAPSAGENAMFDEATGCAAVTALVMACTKLLPVRLPSAARTDSVTVYRPGFA